MTSRPSFPLTRPLAADTRDDRDAWVAWQARIDAARAAGDAANVPTIREAVLPSGVRSGRGARTIPVG